MSQAWRRRIIQVRDEANRRLVALGLSAEVVAAVVAAAQRSMVDAADLFVADYLTVERQEVTPPVGVVASDHVRPEKTARAVRTAQERHSAGDLIRSVGLIVVSDITWSARSAQREAMTRQPEVWGWRRMTGGDPCPLCRALADGSVLPDRTDLAGHPGCSCVAVPAVRGRDDRYLPTTFPQEDSRDG